MKISRLILLWLTLAILACDNAQTKSDDNTITEQNRPPIPHDLPLAKPLDIELGITRLAEVKRRFPDGEMMDGSDGLVYYTLSEKDSVASGIQKAVLIFDDEGHSIVVNLFFDVEKIDYQTIHQSLAEKYLEYPLQPSVEEVDKMSYLSAVYYANRDQYVSGNGVIDLYERYSGEIAEDSNWVEMGTGYQYIIFDSEPEWVNEPEHTINVTYVTDYFHATDQSINLAVSKLAKLSGEIYAIANPFSEQFDKEMKSLSSTREERLFSLVSLEDSLNNIFSEEMVLKIGEYVFDAEKTYWIDALHESRKVNFFERPEFYAEKIEEAEYLLAVTPSVKKYLRSLLALAEDMNERSDAAIIAEHDKAVATLETAVKALDAQRLQKLL